MGIRNTCLGIHIFVLLPIQLDDIYSWVMGVNETEMNFWGRVEIALKDAEIPSLKELCRKADVNYSTMMNNRVLGRLPGLEESLRIAASLGKSVEWLMNGSKDIVLIKDPEEILKLLKSDTRLKSIMSALAVSSKEKLFVVEVILGLR